jgi:hypothetical protein
MYIPSSTVDSELHTGCFDTSTFMTETLTARDRFATIPVLAAAPVYQPASEEELYTSFEQAISDRLLAMNKQLSLKSGSLGHTGHLELNTEPLSRNSQISHHSSMTNITPATVSLQQHDKKTLPALLGNIWQRSFIFVSLALMLILLGFDLMGLLVVHLR